VLLLVYDTKSKVDLVGLLKVWMTYFARQRCARCFPDPRTWSPLTWLHTQNARESLLGVFQRSIAVVEDADAVPKLGVLSTGTRCRVSTGQIRVAPTGCRASHTNLGVRQSVQGLLVSSVGLLQVVHHEVAVAWEGIRKRTSVLQRLVRFGSPLVRQTARPHSPNDPQTSPFSCEMLRTRW
jgi:hypothetical protein